MSVLAGVSSDIVLQASIGLTFFRSAAACLHVPAKLTPEPAKHEPRKRRANERHAVGCSEELDGATRWMGRVTAVAREAAERLQPYDQAGTTKTARCKHALAAAMADSDRLGRDVPKNRTTGDAQSGRSHTTRR